MTPEERLKAATDAVYTLGRWCTNQVISREVAQASLAAAGVDEMEAEIARQTKRAPALWSEMFPDVVYPGDRDAATAVAHQRSESTSFRIQVAAALAKLRAAMERAATEDGYSMYWAVEQLNATIAKLELAGEKQ